MTKSIKLLMAALLLMLINFSCRKYVSDIRLQRTGTTGIIDKFFKLPDNVSAELRAVAADIERQNAKYQFLPAFVKTNGYPVWDKVISNRSINNSGAATGSSAFNNQSVYLIPLKSETTGEIISYITCYQKDSSYSYRFFNKNALTHSYPQSAEAKKLVASNLAVFSAFEKNINNRDNIVFNDFHRSWIKNAHVNIGPGNEEYKVDAVGSTGGHYTILTIVVDYWEFMPSSGDLTGLAPGEIPNYGNWQIVTSSYMVVAWIDDDDPDPILTNGSYINPQDGWFVNGGGITDPGAAPISANDQAALDFGINFGAGNPIADINDYFKCFDNIPGSDHQYTITICVQQPTPGTRTPWNFRQNNSGNPFVVGHTFFILQETTPSKTIRRNVGFYPQTMATPFNPTDQAQLNNDESHEYNVSLEIKVDNSSFTQLLNYISQWTGPGWLYDLNGNNCTTFGLNALHSIGIDIPSNFGSWPLGFGHDPGDLGEDLKSYPLTSAMTLHTSASSHPNLGTCQ